MQYHLIVVHDFGNYTRGQRVTDEAEVAAILEGPNHTHIVKIAAPAAPDVPEPARGQ